MTLGSWLTDFAITTYPDVLHKCSRIGVQPPSLEEFTAVCPTAVTKQTSGVIVVDVGTLAEEEGERVIGDENQPEGREPDIEPTVSPTKIRRKKKEESNR